MESPPFHEKSRRFQTGGFALFASKTQDQVLMENPTLTRVEVIQKLAAMWASLSPSARATFSEDVHQATNRFDFTFEDPLRAVDAPSPAEEAVVCASSMISQMEPPSDPQGYLMWVGAHVVNQYFAAHGDIPHELTERLAKGEFVTLPTVKESGDFGLSEVMRSLPALETPT